MKIFFIAAIQGKKDFGDTYKFIADKIKALGHTVVSDNYLFNVSDDEFSGMEDTEDLHDLHKKIIQGIKSADIVIVEVSLQRISLGYFISIALDLGKPTIALHTGKEKYHLLSTLELNDKFVSYRYEGTKDLDKEIPLLIDFSSDQQDTRFNFFISPKHQNFLDWVSKTKKIPRSVYLRNLIEEDMKKETKYSR